MLTSSINGGNLNVCVNLYLASTDTVLGNIDSNEEKRSITQKHTEGKTVINSVNVSFYTDIIDKRCIIYCLLDIEDGEQESAIISGSSTNENKREESGDVPHEDHSEGKTKKTI